MLRPGAGSVRSLNNHIHVTVGFWEEALALHAYTVIQYHGIRQDTRETYEVDDYGNGLYRASHSGGPRYVHLYLRGTEELVI
jgi:hypothetical protein